MAAPSSSLSLSDLLLDLPLSRSFLFGVFFRRSLSRGAGFTGTRDSAVRSNTHNADAASVAVVFWFRLLHLTPLFLPASFRILQDAQPVDSDVIDSECLANRDCVAAIWWEGSIVNHALRSVEGIRIESRAWLVRPRDYSALHTEPSARQTSGILTRRYFEDDPT
jgi:hypothetical protein